MKMHHLATLRFSTVEIAIFRGVRSDDIKAIVGFFDRAFKIAIDAQGPIS
jgi:hypothetical protein